LVICYAYLWLAEHRQGREEGVKDRPCVIVLARRNEADGETVVTVVPVTHTPPGDPEAAVEIAPATKRRLGLDDDRSWIIVGELNRFVWPDPDLRPVSVEQLDRFDYGVLPPRLFRAVKVRLLLLHEAKKFQTVPRTS
jgi:hypothetical protein